MGHFEDRMPDTLCLAKGKAKKNNLKKEEFRTSDNVVELRSIGGNRRPLIDVGKVIINSGIAWKVFEAFMEQVKQGQRQGIWTPADNLEVKKCRFEIRYDSGAALDKDPSDYRVIMYYPGADRDEYFFRADLDGEEGSCRNPVNLTPKQIKLVGQLANKDFGLHKQFVNSIVGPCVAYLKSDSKDGIDWSGSESQAVKDDLTNKKEIIEMIAEFGINLDDGQMESKPEQKPWWWPF